MKERHTPHTLIQTSWTSSDRQGDCNGVEYCVQSHDKLSHSLFVINQQTMLKLSTL